MGLFNIARTIKTAKQHPVDFILSQIMLAGQGFRMELILTQLQCILPSVPNIGVILQVTA